MRRRLRDVWIGIAIALAWTVSAIFAESSNPEMSWIPAGVYRPLYTGDQIEVEPVVGFWLDQKAVTNAQFLRFADSHSEWKRGRPPAIKADQNYLRHWKKTAGGGAKGYYPPTASLRAPVVNVSWFAARAYCKSLGKRLPTVAEWERAALAPDAARPHEGEEALVRRILEWYGKKNSVREVGTVYRNVYGVYDMHGSVWEWIVDFNSVTIDSDSREGGQSAKFCGAGGFNSSSPRDYAAFMRQAFRSGLTAASTTRNLGFRCARSVD